MRLMWLWVLLYALGAGFMLLLMGFIFTLGFALSYFHGIAADVGQGASSVALIAPMVGVLVLIAGFILLLIRGKFQAGRMVSLVGTYIYYFALLALIVAAIIFMILTGSPSWWQHAAFTAATVVIVVLPGFFITRELIRE
jgi:nitrate reductase gamma subunit